MAASLPRVIEEASAYCGVCGGCSFCGGVELSVVLFEGGGFTCAGAGWTGAVFVVVVGAGFVGL